VAINTTIEENLVIAQFFWALLKKFGHQLWRPKMAIEFFSVAQVGNIIFRAMAEMF
jgi:hypothetical protein